MQKEYRCIRCGAIMRYMGREFVQLGKNNAWNTVKGGIELDMIYCPECRKMEFFLADAEVEKDEFKGSTDLPKERCNSCGRYYDFDFSKCPYCGHHHY